MSYRLLFVVLLGTLLYSCVPHRKTVYLQSKEEGRDSILARQEFVYQVQPKDILYISVTSYNSQLTDFFNVKKDGTSSNYYMTGFMVDNKGYIHIPVLDSMHVGGLSVQEVQDKLKREISEYVTGPNVIVKLVNFKVTVLGEVSRQGIQNMEGDVFTILEAIALAGGVSELGDMENVRLVRKEGDSSRIITINLTQRDIIHSEFYYLQPNDVIYVEPLRAKAARGNFRIVRDGLGILTFILIVLRIRNMSF